MVISRLSIKEERMESIRESIIVFRTNDCMFYICFSLLERTVSSRAH